MLCLLFTAIAAARNIHAFRAHGIWGGEPVNLFVSAPANLPGFAGELALFAGGRIHCGRGTGNMAPWSNLLLGHKLSAARRSFKEQELGIAHAKLHARNGFDGLAIVPDQSSIHTNIANVFVAGNGDAHRCRGSGRYSQDQRQSAGRAAQFHRDVALNGRHGGRRPCK